ncbi:ribbon-helix-helix domain-containing protein [Ancylobacter sonchi]|uniref:ribbon-helix-helix domain-containing protein n=1 Tax=Ancylobacter sonchi TaxID=1937790 RepID=UPI001BD4074E|nr:ribbon-helix-helix domain-containing protein [Ancylobacter sonchi]
MSLEFEFFEAIKDIARRERRSLGSLAHEIDANRASGTNLSAAIRLYVLADLQQRLAS